MDNTSPKISVITICMNSESLVAETVTSVLEQKYENLEYIIIDGKSVDKTLATIQSAISGYPSRNVQVISEPDKGIADAMNKGVARASGEVIIHLHAGDRFIDDSAVEKVMSSFRRDKWRWAVASSIVVDEKGRRMHVYSANPDYRILLKKNCIPHQSTFLVKDIFDKHGGFDVSYKQAMDYEFWLRIVFKGGERYAVLPFATTYFRHGGKSSNIRELLTYLARLRKSLRHYGCKNSTLSDRIFLLRVMAFYYFVSIKRVIGSWRFLSKSE